MKKSWVEKRDGDPKDLPKIVRLDPKGVLHWKGETMVVPSPQDVDAVMRGVPEGKLITVNEIRQILAKKFKADIGCPLTCGIFVWIAANAAEEERELGREDITPWWRTLKKDGLLNEKYPGDITLQRTILEGEGHKIIKKGNKYQVKDYERSLVKL